jgi:hypothetical protein
MVKVAGSRLVHGSIVSTLLNYSLNLLAENRKLPGVAGFNLRHRTLPEVSLLLLKVVPVPNTDLRDCFRDIHAKSGIH